MKYALWGFAFLTIFVAWYASPLGRELLKRQSWMQRYYSSPFAERVEILLFNKSDTLLWNRFKAIAASGWSLVLLFGGVDFGPFLFLIPEQYHHIVKAAPAMIYALDGVYGEIQRRWTTKTVAQVAVPEAVPIPADVKEKMEKADAAKQEAVAEIEVAQAEGKNV